MMLNFAKVLATLREKCNKETMLNVCRNSCITGAGFTGLMPATTNRGKRRVAAATGD